MIIEELLIFLKAAICFVPGLWIVNKFYDRNSGFFKTTFLMLFPFYGGMIYWAWVF